jgi:prophage regulatory protein
MEAKDAVSYTDDHLLRIDDLVDLTTLSKSCINLWVAQGKFPKPLALSKTVKVWRMSEVRKWLNTIFTGVGASHE